MNFYSDRKLREMGFASVGKNVKVSKKTSFYGHSRISLGDYSRIDDFSVISAGQGGIFIGRYVHIAVMCSLIGKDRITLGDFSGLSSRVCIYSSSDDYSGQGLTNPTVPEDFTNVYTSPVVIGKHCIIGAGTVLLPGSHLGDGAAVGALSLVKGHLDPFVIYSGCPVRAIKQREKKLLEFESILDGLGL